MLLLLLCFGFFISFYFLTQRGYRVCIVTKLFSICPCFTFLIFQELIMFVKWTILFITRVLLNSYAFHHDHKGERVCVCVHCDIFYMFQTSKMVRSMNAALCMWLDWPLRKMWASSYLENIVHVEIIVATQFHIHFFFYHYSLCHQRKYKESVTTI